MLTQLQTLAVPNVSGLVSVAVDAGSKATSVYVAGSGSNSIGVFARDKSDGTLSQPGTQPQTCVNAAGSGGCTAAPGLGQIGTLDRGRRLQDEPVRVRRRDRRGRVLRPEQGQPRR